MANSNIANSNTVTVSSGEPAYTLFATVMAHHKHQEARQSPPNFPSTKTGTDPIADLSHSENVQQKAVDSSDCRQNSEK
ncbi:hypothetical protein B0A54_17679 [Friedmanniomyces endolithicus]|uniref:Uncharacterized protein n=1 Tax=Friedmanniomyces endolithicus TaxID=329885 RepID=A0A4U0TSN6_9PEZI|nr:hypothetical protein B0A54_17679 [Friedmanniomyces endolithicus]